MRYIYGNNRFEKTPGVDFGFKKDLGPTRMLFKKGHCHI